METQIIDEQLEDKQQIVTYKYLVEKLDIHPNKAKLLLKEYVSKLTEDKKYSITIAIGGTMKENDDFCIVLAYNDHVETMRRRFKQVDFEHVYSVQPTSRLDDINNALYLADSLLNNNVNISTSIKRKEKENTSLHESSIEIPMEMDDLPPTNSTTNKVLNHSSETALVETKSVKTPKKKAGSDFFAKNNKTPKEIEKKVVPKKTDSDFFSKFKKSNNNNTKAADSNNDVSVENGKNKEGDKKCNVKTPNKNLPENSTTKETLDKNLQENSTAKEMLNKSLQENSTIKDSTEKIKKSNKKKSYGNKNKSALKNKRKRIQTFDSSDEEIDSEEEDKKRSEQIIDEEDIDFVQPTPPRPTPRENRKREKQITTTTYEDEDGFICTTKEVKIVETESELPESSLVNVENSEPKEEPIKKKLKLCGSDAPVQADKKKGKNKQSKNTSSQGLKQSSLTSFFKTK